MDGTAYCRELETLGLAISQCRKELAVLMRKKKEVESELYHYMSARSLTTLNNVKLERITPKPRNKRRTKKEKRENAIRLFTEAGIPDPKGFYSDFVETQTAVPAEDEG